MSRALLILLLFSACSSAGSEEAAKATPFASSASGPTLAASELLSIPALANAGPDQEVIRGAVVTLDGRRSFQPEGKAFTLRWSQTSGSPVVTLSNAAKAVTTFIAPPKATDLGFTLIATSQAGRTIEDDVVVHVVDVATRIAPTLLTNGDRIVPPLAEATLSAFLVGGELDSDVLWTQVFGALTKFQSSGPFGKNLVANAPESGYAIFSVQGSSKGMNSAPDFAVVAPQATGEQALLADPTELPQLQVAPGAQVELLGTDQSAASLWTQLIGDPVRFRDQLGWVFTAPSTPQLLWFSYVKDGTALRTSPLVLVVSVLDPSLDDLVCNAGPDQGAHFGVTVTLDATASTALDTTKYEWTQTYGSRVTLDDASAIRPKFTAPAQAGDLVFVLRLKGTLGFSPADSIVVTVRDASENEPPRGTITAKTFGSASYDLHADFRDRDNDPFTCTWSGAAAFDTRAGQDVRVTLMDATATLFSVTCCDNAPDSCATAERTLP